MTHNIENSKINAAVDMLIESDNDLSNILGKEQQFQICPSCYKKKFLCKDRLSIYLKIVVILNFL